MSNSLEVDTNLTYCPTTLTVNNALVITNVSDEELVFKVNVHSFRSKPIKRISYP